jgi:hypothetical protein
MNTCDWNSPGAGRYTGTTEAAVHAYADIPVAVRGVLIKRMNSKDYDDHVTITRDAVQGKNGYDPDLREMHFGASGKVCSTVSRAAWPVAAVERGLVYCVDGHCLVVPSVCGNVARVSRKSGEFRPEPSPGLTAETFESMSAVPVALDYSHAEPPEFPEATLVATPVFGGLGGPFAALGGPSPVAPVPEPSTWALMLAGIFGLAWAKRRRAR